MPFAALGRAFDAEWFLLSDAERGEEELAAIDRRALEGVAASSPSQRFDAWLSARRKKVPRATPGVQLARALHLVHLGLCFFSLGLGAAAAGALLRPATSFGPVNWLEFLVVTGFVPALGLGLTALVLLLRRGRMKLGLRSDLIQGLALRLGSLLATHASGASPRLSAVWGQVRATGGRYRELEALSLAIVSQDCALCFQLAAALSLLRLALLSDLYFAWATTFGAVRAEQLSSVVDLLQAPWVWAWPSLAVNLPTVRLTQYSRLDRQFVDAAGAALSGAWWPFLFGCLLLYGVVPRASLALGLRWWLAASVRRVPGRVLPLRRRLSRGLGVAARSGPSSGPPRALPPVRPYQQAAESEVASWFVSWRGAPLPEGLIEGLCRDYHLRSVATHSAGGADYGKDAALLQSLATSPAVCVVVVEGWEAPDKSIRRFLADMREGSSGSMRLVVVLRQEGQPSQLRVWRDRLSLLADPQLTVEERTPVSAPGLGRRP